MLNIVLKFANDSLKNIQANDFNEIVSILRDYKEQTFDLTIIIDESLSPNQEILESILTTLDKSVYCTNFIIESALDNPDLLSLQKEAQEISARNRLIKHLGLNTTQEGFDPWSNLMSMVYNEYSTTKHFNVPAISCHCNNKAFPLIKLTESYFTHHIQLNLLKMGKKGFRAFLDKIFETAKNNNQAIIEKKFLYIVPLMSNSEELGISLYDFLDIVLDSQKKYGIPFPFEDLTLINMSLQENSRNLIFDEKTHEKYFEFLELNPHIDFIEIDFIKYIEYECQVKILVKTTVFDDILNSYILIKNTNDLWEFYFIDNNGNKNIIDITENKELNAVLNSISDHPSLQEEDTIKKVIRKHHGKKCFLESAKNKTLTTSIRFRNELDELNDILINNKRLVQEKKILTETIEETPHFQSIALPKRWYLPRPQNDYRKLKLQTQFSVNHSQSLEQNTTLTLATNLATQRTRQIENQNQRRQELKNQHSSFLTNMESSQFIQEENRNEKFEEQLDPYDSDFSAMSRPDRHAYKNNFWHSITGEKATIFHRVTETAYKKLLLNDEAIFGGLSIDHLPEGFFIHEEKNNGNIIRTLCFNRLLKNDKKDSPLTVKLRKHRNEFINCGTANQYNISTLPSEPKKLIEESHSLLSKCFNKKCPPEEILNAFLNLAEAENADEAKIIKQKKYIEILKTFNSSNLIALRSIFFEGGTKSLKKFLSKLKKLQKKGLFEAFKIGFIDPCVNLIELSTREAYDAIDKICQFNENEAAWWTELTMQQGNLKWVKSSSKLIAPLFLEDCVAAFRYFCEEIKKLDPAIELPNPCYIKEAKNIIVSLDRILYIVKNAADPREQLYNLKNVSLHQEAAFYAVKYENFYFVSEEMELTNDNPSSAESFSYKVNVEQLYDLSNKNTQEDISFFKRYFFRYLGTQQYLYRFDTYRKLYAHIFNEKNFSISCKQQLLTIIAVVATRKAALGVDPFSILNSVIEQLQSLDNTTQILLLKTIWDLVKNTESGVEITDLNAMLLFLKQPINLQLMDSSEIASDFNQKIKTYKRNGIIALTKLGNKTLDNLSGVDENINDFLTICEISSSSSSTELTDSTSQLLVALSVFHIKNIVIDDIKKDIQNISQNYPEAWKNLLAALSEINTATSTQLPTHLLFQELEKYFKNNKNTSKIEVINFIKEQYNGINFNQLTFDSYQKDCSAALKRFLQNDNVKLLLQIAGYSEVNIDEQVITPNDILEFFKQNLYNIKNNILDNAKIKSLMAIFCELQRSYILTKFKEHILLSESSENILFKNINNILKTPESLELMNEFMTRIQDIDNFIMNISEIKITSYHKEILEFIVKEINKNPEKIEEIFKISSIFKEKSKLKIEIKKLIFIYIIRNKNHAEELENLLYSIYAKLSENQNNFYSLLKIILNKKEIKIEIKIMKSIDVVLDKIKNNKPEIFSEEFLDIALNKKESFDFLNFSLNIINIYLERPEKISQNLIKIIFNLLKLQKLYPDDIAHEKHTALAKKMSSCTEDEINSIAALFNTYPYPSIDDLLANSSIELIVNQHLQKNFNNLSKRKGYQDFDSTKIVEKIGSFYNLYQEVHPNNDEIKKYLELYQIACQDADISSQLTNLELSKALMDYKKQLSSSNKISEKGKIRAQLLGYLREIFYRTTDPQIYPNSTQILAVLYSIEKGGNVVSGIETGEGKTAICSLQAAMLWCEGHTVDFCTSNSTLAARDLQIARNFYQFIGAKTVLIQDDSPSGTYQRGEINYADPASMSLHRAKELANGTWQPIPGPVSLILDEADHTIFDELSQYILSVNDNQSGTGNSDAWIYPWVNRFVDYLDNTLSEPPELLSKEFTPYFLDNNGQPKKKPYSVFDEVMALRTYLYDRSEVDNRPRLTEKYFAFQLDIWMVSSRKARQLSTENKISYLIGEEEINEKLFSKAIVLQNIEENPTPNHKARWGQGVHQLLHARLNSTLRTDAPPFICEPEVKPLSITSNHNFVNYYTKNGRLLCNTGTPGSASEIQELHNNNFEVIKVPLHEKKEQIILPPLIAKDLTTQKQLIKKKVRKKKNFLSDASDRPCLVLCKNAIVAEEIYNYLKKEHLDVNLLTGENKEQTEEFIDKAGEHNKILVSTICRRGTNITTNHPEGLLVIPTCISSVRVASQEAGRTSRNGRPGTVEPIFNDEEIQTEYGIKLRNKSKEEQEKLIQFIQSKMEQNQQYGRECNFRFSLVISIIQSAIDELLSNEDIKECPQARDKILKIKKDILNELSKKWNEMQESYSDFNEDDFNLTLPQSKLNHITPLFIAEAECSFTNEVIGKVIAILNEHNLSETCQVILEKIQRIRIKDTLLLSGTLTSDQDQASTQFIKTTTSIEGNKPLSAEKDIIEDTANDPSIIQSNEIESENLIERYYLQFPIDENHASIQEFKIACNNILTNHHLVNFISRQATKLTLPTKINTVLAYKQQQKNSMLQSAIKIIQFKCEYYTATSSFISDDRVALANSLSTEAAKAKNFCEIINILNNTYNHACSDDIEENKKRLLFKRVEHSRFRNEILLLKSKLYALCPPAEFSKIVEIEMAQLNKYVLYFQSLNKLPENLKNDVKTLESIIQLSSDQTHLEKLTEILSTLEKFIRHPDYSKEKYAWHIIYSSLQSLFLQAKQIMEPERNHTYSAYQSLKHVLLKLKIEQPVHSSTSRFFFKTDYSLPENHIFKNIINNEQFTSLSEKNKYKLYTLCSIIQNHLMQNFSAYDINITNSENFQLKISYKLCKTKNFNNDLNTQKKDFIEESKHSMVVDFNLDIDQYIAKLDIAGKKGQPPSFNAA